MRLRLGLDSTLLCHPPPDHSSHTHSLPAHSRRTQLFPPLTRNDLLSCDHLEDEILTRAAAHSKKTKPQGHHHRGDEPALLHASKDQRHRSTNTQDVFQYLSSKYGTPAEQLKRLAVSGSFRTRRMDCVVGGGVSVRWPVEANIIHATPQHVLDTSPPLQPFYQQDQGVCLCRTCVPNNYENVRASYWLKLIL